MVKALDLELGGFEFDGENRQSLLNLQSTLDVSEAGLSLITEQFFSN